MQYDCLCSWYPVSKKSVIVLGIEKRIPPTISVVVLVLMLVRNISQYFTRLWSVHEMPAAESSDDVESEVQVSAVSVRRVQIRESSSNV